MDYLASGTIHKEGKHLLKALQKLAPEIKGRPRLFGFDISFEDEEVEIYINSYDDLEFNIEISTSDFSVLVKYMEIVKKACEKLKCQYDITYSNSEEDFMYDTLYSKSE